MSKIMYLAKSWTEEIERISVAKVTEKSAFFENGRREALTSTSTWIRDSFDEAKAELVNHRQKCLKSAEASVAYMKERLDKALKIQDNVND